MLFVLIDQFSKSSVKHNIFYALKCDGNIFLK